MQLKSLAQCSSAGHHSAAGTFIGMHQTVQMDISQLRGTFASIGARIMANTFGRVSLRVPSAVRGPIKRSLPGCMHPDDEPVRHLVLVGAAPEGLLHGGLDVPLQLLGLCLLLLRWGRCCAEQRTRGRTKLYQNVPPVWRTACITRPPRNIIVSASLHC